MAFLARRPLHASAWRRSRGDYQPYIVYTHYIGLTGGLAQDGNVSWFADMVSHITGVAVDGPVNHQAHSVNVPIPVDVAPTGATHRRPSWKFSNMFAMALSHKNELDVRFSSSSQMSYMPNLDDRYSVWNEQ